MSSLRVASLRLCWLEAFIAVAEAENISEAARSLRIDQSTVSRYMQALEKWVGKKLIEVGRISDPQDPGVSIGLTEAGREFFAIAEGVVQGLNGFREEKARKQEIIEDIGSIVSSMDADRKRRPVLDITKLVDDNIDQFKAVFEHLHEGYPDDFLLAYQNSLRTFFNRYENERKRERFFRRRAKPSPVLMPEWLEQNRRYVQQNRGPEL